MLEAHFAGIASQSSVYGLTSLSTRTGPHKVLIASSKRKVYCLEYSWNNKNLIPSTREVQFTYIPGAADIVSIDVFNQASHEHDFVVGITFVKGNAGGKKNQYFNIYSDWKPSHECDLDKIAQGCLSLSLDFIPFQLTHTELVENGVKEMVWLVSGNDNKVHLYREDKSCQSFCEESSEVFFPEFQDLNSIVLWMDFMTSNEQRLTAFGCKNGIVKIVLVDFMSEIKIVYSKTICHDGPISCVRLFFDRTSPLSANKALNNDEDQTDKSDVFETPIHLLVGNTLETSVVYRDILKKGLSSRCQNLLLSSNKYDCVTCACIADIDMDGEHEILLGTYGQQLLIYKWKGESTESKGTYSLFYQQSFPNPLLAIAYIDIKGDSIKELLVLSTKGLHILQHNHNKIVEKCIQHLKTL